MLQFEFRVICVERMLQARFIGLTPSDKPFKDISGLKSALINKQMIRVQSFHIHVHVIDLHDTQKPQITIINIVIKVVISAKFKKTVQIAFVYYSECLVCLPFETRSNNFDGILSSGFIPHSIDEVWRKIVVDKLSPCFPNQKLLVAEVEIELQIEVWREQIRHTGLC